jgi:acetyl-CoA synthetase
MRRMTTPGPDIQSVLRENRVFAPPSAFAARAHVASEADYRKLYERSMKDPEAFWAEMAREHLNWFRPWERVLSWQPPFARWFEGGQLNVSYNCVDRHLATWRRNKVALRWEGEPGEVRSLTYHDLHREVCRFANALRSLGVCKGDRVAIYMPMVPEAVIAMLACTRIGAPHSVIFGGFSAEAIRDRLRDAGASVVVTADGGYRRGKVVPLKPNVDRALAEQTQVRHVVVVVRADNRIEMEGGRDHFWDDLVRTQPIECAAEPLDAEHPLYILYTSGSTGKPKGVLHTTGGYLLQTALTTKWVFDLQDDDTYWCTADIGWVTGHSYVVYGPLANGATVVMYEGAPDSPDKDRFWRIIESHGVSVLYTAPTAIRTFMRWGEEYPKRCDLRSLRLLGTVGEPINPEAWMWYHRLIGGGRCPVVDTWWQTETGAIMISPLPGATPTKPGSCTRPLPGVAADIVAQDGTTCGPNQGGRLVIKQPWPSMLRTIWGDEERYRKQYFSEVEGAYFTGDGARRDEDGYFWVVGRIDDVLNVAGHRIGTAEVESALVAHPKVAEAAVVGRPDELKGQVLVAFVTLRSGSQPSAALKDELRAHVATQIGAIAKPEDVRWAEALPKTRSGKIMRRLLKELATTGEIRGDTTTLEDFGALAKLRDEE